MLGNKEIMAKNIRQYMELRNKSRNDICEALGIAYSTFTDWINANKYPRIDKIEMLANYFHISKADLVEDRDPEADTVRTLTPDQMELLCHYELLNAIGRSKAQEYVSDLADQAKYREDTGSSTSRAG